MNASKPEHTDTAATTDRKPHPVVSIGFSGSGTDGTVGLQKIKVQGGMCLAQTPSDADFPGMPKSAIASGAVDFVGPARDLAQKADAYFNIGERGE